MLNNQNQNLNPIQNLNMGNNQGQGYQNNQVTHGQQANGKHVGGYDNTSNIMGTSQGGVMQNTSNMVNTIYGTGGDARRLDTPNDMIVSNHEHI